MPEKAPAWRILSIQDVPGEGRKAFACGRPALDDYLRLYARQNDGRGIGKTWVALGPLGHAVVAYRTLSAAQVAFHDLPEAMRRRLPSYPVPAVRLSRLAVDGQHQGKRLGELLLGDAVDRALVAARQIGFLLMVVDAKDEKAAGFYAKYGFVRLPGIDGVLVMVLKG